LTITGLSFGNSLELDAVRSADQQRAAPTCRFPNATSYPAATHPLTYQFSLHPADCQRQYLNDRHSQRREYASLTITSNDPDQPTRSVNLAGLNSADYEGNNEPSIAEFARTFGWSLNVGTEKQSLGGTKTLLGDEVYSPYWLRADTTKPVLLWPLAVYSGRGNNPWWCKIRG